MSDTPETKTLTVELKADSEGEFSATFATLNVIDHHGDVTVPGAFKNGTEVLVGAYQHQMGSLPVGKAIIRSDEERAWVEGKFFTDTTHGRDTYLTVKNAGGAMEWSYVFQPTEWEVGEFAQKDKTEQVRFLKGIDVWSVDPVLRGAGLGTGTDSVKSRLTFTEHIAGGIASVAHLVSRVEARAAMRRTEGRELSADGKEQAAELVIRLGELRARLEEVLDEGREDVADIEANMSRALLEYAEYEARKAS